MMTNKPAGEAGSNNNNDPTIADAVGPKQERPTMPLLVAELARLIIRMPVVRDQWKRLRIAVSREEWLEIQQYYFADNEAVRGEPVAHMSIRGVPLVLEDEPLNPMIEVTYV